MSPRVRRAAYRSALLIGFALGCVVAISSVIGFQRFYQVFVRPPDPVALAVSFADQVAQIRMQQVNAAVNKALAQAAAGVEMPEISLPKIDVPFRLGLNITETARSVLNKIDSMTDIGLTAAATDTARAILNKIDMSMPEMNMNMSLSVPALNLSLNTLNLISSNLSSSAVEGILSIPDLDLGIERTVHELDVRDRMRRVANYLYLNELTSYYNNINFNPLNMGMSSYYGDEGRTHHQRPGVQLSKGGPMMQDVEVLVQRMRVLDKQGSWESDEQTGGGGGGSLLMQMVLLALALAPMVPAVAASRPCCIKIAPSNNLPGTQVEPHDCVARPDLRQKAHRAQRNPRGRKSRGRPGPPPAPCAGRGREANIFVTSASA
jgi:hypothetical protein